MGAGGWQKCVYVVCVCVIVREGGRLDERKRQRGGTGQATLTLRCLRPSRATDPVSNSPLLAELMPATTSYHTICSGDCPALFSTTPTSTINWAELCIMISILLRPHVSSHREQLLIIYIYIDFTKFKIHNLFITSSLILLCIVLIFQLYHRI